MDDIKKELEGYDKSKVDIYVAYLKSLQAEKKDGKIVNYWYKDIAKEQFIDVFKKASDRGLSIDGDSVTLTYRKKLVITCDYHAYMNRVLLSHPETVFDFELVYENDTYEFNKENGCVNYTHQMKDPFGERGKIVGAYGIIKNDKGEFLETLNMEEIAKMQNTSKMGFIWKTWFDRMVLKSVIKRICSIHFKDITRQMDEIDNETNSPELANIPSEIQEEINNAKDKNDLTEIYNKNIDTINDRSAFIKILGDKRKELE